MQLSRSMRIRSSCKFQSSPVPEDGCNVCYRGYGRDHQHVSILTRPGGRVQRHRIVARSTVMRAFQSSPVPEDGCNELVAHDVGG